MIVVMAKRPTRISAHVSHATRDALSRMGAVYRTLHPDRTVDALYAMIAARMLDEFTQECARRGIDASASKTWPGGRPPKVKTTQPAPRPRTHYGPED